MLNNMKHPASEWHTIHGTRPRLHGVLIIVLILLTQTLTLAEQTAVDLIRDPHFRNGFMVIGPTQGKRIIEDRFTVEPGTEPIWHLDQWNSRFSIAGTEPNYLPGGVIRYANQAKAVTIAPAGTEEADLTLTIDSNCEYDGRLRKGGQPWPHLLVEQKIENSPTIGELARLDFHIEARLLHNHRFEPEGYTTDLHCAQVPFVVTIQNRNQQSPGYGDFLWFLVPIYDDRWPFPRPHVAQDTADPSAKLIYNPGAKAYTDKSLHTGEWVTIDADLLPHVRNALEAAWSKGYLQDSKDPCDYRISTTNLGWEAPGLNQSSIQIRNLSLRAVTGSAQDDTALNDAIRWLEGESHRLIRASRRTMADGTAAFPPQVGLGYEAFWLRDYAYTLEGSVDSYSDRELLDACRTFVRNIRADGAGVDCVKFDGRAIYKPGFGSMGENPVADGSQFTVSVAWHTCRRTKDLSFLQEIIEPLLRTMRAVPRNPESGLVHIKDSEWDRCPYGFTDTVRMQGDVLFCSLLYVEASHRLADLLNALGREDEAVQWQREADRVARNIRDVFWDSEVGLFRAATIRCKEHHIWGSAFAVYLNVADQSQSRAIAGYFRDHYTEIVQNGQIRHLPGGVYWQTCQAARDTYQNGAYWATPTGWFVYTLNLVDPQLADRTIIDMVTDFREHGAAEWVFGPKHQLPNYLASASLPLAGIRAMIEHRR